jgi:hypothetical protein
MSEPGKNTEESPGIEARRVITQQDIKKMSESELAVLASKAPDGFTPVFYEDGSFEFRADWSLEEMTPSERAKFTVVRRAH